MLNHQQINMVKHIYCDANSSDCHCRNNTLNDNAVITTTHIIIAQCGHYFLFGRQTFVLCLVDKVDGIHEIHVILIQQCRVFCKFHQIGCLEQLSQFVHHLLVAILLQMI